MKIRSAFTLMFALAVCDMSVAQPLTNPNYPLEEARHQHEGKAVINFLVSKDGSVSDVRLEKSTGWYGLDQAALKFPYNARFRPGIQDGKPTAMRKTMAVQYRVQNETFFPADPDPLTGITDALHAYRVYEKSTHHLLDACAGIGLDTERAREKLRAEVDKFRSRADELTAFMQNHPPAVGTPAYHLFIALTTDSQTPRRRPMSGTCI